MECGECGKLGSREPSTKPTGRSATQECRAELNESPLVSTGMKPLLCWLTGSTAWHDWGDQQTRGELRAPSPTQAQCIYCLYCLFPCHFIYVGMTTIVLLIKPFIFVIEPWNLAHDRNETSASYNTQNFVTVSMANNVKGDYCNFLT